MTQSKMHTQSGSVLTALFVGIALLGFLSYTTYNLLNGPVRSAATVSMKTKAMADASLAAKLLMRSATDIDGDGLYEPPGFDATGTVKPVGGGTIPSTIGAAKVDPWHIPYGYCGWDVAPNGGTPLPAGTSLLPGSASTDPSVYGATIVVAVISAGPNRKFETTCGNDPAYLTTAANSDDIIESYTFNEAVTLELWKKRSDVGKNNIQYASDSVIIGNPTTIGAERLQVAGNGMIDGNLAVTGNGVVNGTLTTGALAASSASITGTMTAAAASVGGLAANGAVTLSGTAGSAINGIAIGGTTPAVGYFTTLGVTDPTLVTNLNADQLDGQDGTYYTNAANLNAGQIDPARLPTLTTDVTLTRTSTTAAKATVKGLLGYAFNPSTVPATGSVPLFSGTDWTLAPLSLAGDVTGPLATTSVVKLRGYPIASTAPTANTVLAWNGSAWAPMPIGDGTGGTVGGGGTFGGILADKQVAFGTGANMIGGSNNFIWDNANSRLGIGRAPDTNKSLDIQFNSTAGGSGVRIQNTNPSGYSEVIFNNDNNRADGTAVFGYGGSATSCCANTFYLDNRIGPLQFYTNDTMRVTMAATGNVGIGTDAPVAKLDVNGNINTNSTISAVNPHQTTATVKIVTDDAGIFKYRTLSEVFADSGGGVAAGNPGNVQFNNGGALGGMDDFFWDKTAKYLGLGTNAPRTNLDIFTNVINTTSDYGVFVITGVDHYGQALTLQSPVASYNGTLLTSYKATGATGLAMAAGVKFANDQPDYFGILDPSGTTSFAVKASGNVGIGTTSPAALLDVNGTLTAAGAVKFTNLAGTGVRGVSVDANGVLTTGSATTPAGDVTGPASSTDTAIAIFDGTTGKLLKNSGILIDSTAQLTFPMANGPGYFGAFNRPENGFIGFSKPGVVMMGISNNTSRIGFGGGVYFTTSEPAALVEIRGKANEIQQVIRGNTTQTQNLTEWRNSGDTIRAAIDPVGSFMTLGTITAANPVQTTAATKIVTDDGGVLKTRTLSEVFADASAAGANNATLPLNADNAPTATRRVIEINAAADPFLGYRGTDNVYLGAAAGKTLDGGSTLPQGVTLMGKNAGLNTTGNFSTFVGSNAGSANTSGAGNTLLGSSAGIQNTTGGNNTFVGIKAGYTNSTAGNNTFVGSAAGYSNTSGTPNVFIGNNAGYSNTTGGSNVFTGANAGYSITIGARNVFTGTGAGGNTTTANDNVFVGDSAGSANTTGASNTFIGSSTGVANTTGTQNTMIGYMAGSAVTTNGNNTFLGYQSGKVNTSANNTFLGNQSGQANTTGANNLFIGQNAGVANTTAANNTFVGTLSGQANITGTRNTFLGYYAGWGNTASDNTFLGQYAGKSSTSGDSNVYVGSNAGTTATTATGNAFVGKDAGMAVTTGGSNTFIGGGAGYKTTTGTQNIFIGYNTGHENVSGTQNIALGNYGVTGSRNVLMGGGNGGDNNVLIGYNAGSNTTTASSNNVFIGYAAGIATTSAISNVFIGFNSGGSNVTGTRNTYLGYQSGYAGTASDNTFLGYNTGMANTAGTQNTFAGTNAGAANTTGNNNAYFGNGAGQSATGSTNTFIGNSAGYNATGANNVFVGHIAGTNDTSGNANTFVGRGAGTANTTGASSAFFGYGAGAAVTTASNLSFFGFGAGSANTSGTSNSFFGYQAGMGNTTGANNSFFGYQTGQTATTGNDNAFFGTFAGGSTTSSYNTAVGSRSGQMTTGSDNALVGYLTGNRLTSGGNNVFMGSQAGSVATTAGNNVFIGGYAGVSNTTGATNTFVGANAGQSNTTASNNAFFGYQSGIANTTGTNNLFLGTNSGAATTTGASNTFVGSNAGAVTTTGASNTFIGAGAGNDASQFATATNSIAIGNGTYTTANNQTVIGNTSMTTAIIRGAVTLPNLAGTGVRGVSVDANGLLTVGTGGTTLPINADNAPATSKRIIEINAGANPFLGYRGDYNVYLGQSAGNSLDANGGGSSNTMVGYSAGATVTGSENTMLGTSAGANSGSKNASTYIGYQAGQGNAGDNNTFIGNRAGGQSTATSGGTLIGYKAGYNNTTGGGSTFIGFQAGLNNTSGSVNTFIGYNAGLATTNQDGVTAIGYYAGGANANSNNTYIGTAAGQSTTSGSGTFIGSYAGSSNTSGSGVFIGLNAGSQNRTGTGNLFIGTYSGQGIQDGSNNAFLGDYTGQQFPASAAGNTVIGADIRGGGGSSGATNNSLFGYHAGNSLTTASNNTFIGAEAGNGGSQLATASNSIAIGNGAVTTANNQFVVARDASNIFMQGDMMNGPLQVKGGTTTLSDARLKTSVVTLQSGLDKVLALRGVTYHWKPEYRKDPREYVGFIAQEVQKILPDVVYPMTQENGHEYLTVSYEQFAPVLVEAIKEQQKTITAQATEIDALKTRMDRLEKMMNDGGHDRMVEHRPAAPSLWQRIVAWVQSMFPNFMAA